MGTLDMSDAEFIAQSRRRGRKVSSVLLTLSTASYFMSRMLIDAKIDDAITFAWISVSLAVSALIMLVILMPINTLRRKMRRKA